MQTKWKVLAALALLGSFAGGCVVRPYGPGYGYHRGYYERPYYGYYRR